jgi:hypothetical protein
MNKSSTDWTQQIAGDLFSIKQKITDDEYLKILTHMKGLYDSIDRSNDTKRTLYVKLQDLRKKYIQLSITFETFFRQVHKPDYDEDNNEVYVVQ